VAMRTFHILAKALTVFSSRIRPHGLDVVSPKDSGQAAIVQLGYSDESNSGFRV
jgi:hypothetical protein